ncbi:LysR family transcriptional regulator [Microbacterium phosphatis]|uniref:LysR family transcriptional regulator n=1 Tax=Microbacterium phosphatis TaxID=3140248 RepID=UPI00314080C4
MALVNVTAAQVRYFVAVADELHFGRAAERLRIAAPSLSQQIARLERTLGAQLFERGPRSVALTAAGRELLPLAREAERTHRAVDRWRPGSDAAALLRVGVVAAGAGSVTTRILREVVETQPRVRVELVRLAFFEGAGSLRRGDVDVVIGPAEEAAGEGILAEPLADEARVLVMPADHPLASRASISITETDDLGFVTIGDVPPPVRDWWLVDPRPSGARPRVVAQADGVEGLMELCAAGIGVNIAAASAETHYRRDDLAFVPIHDIPPARIDLSWREGHVADAVAAFLAVARTVRGQD